MNHTEIIQYLIDKNNYKTYLEIGVTGGNNFNIIRCNEKESCDVVTEDERANTNYEGNITYLMTSDEMFAKMPTDKKYDIIFIDGLHDEEYVDRDIINSLKHLNKYGVICVHDTLPYYDIAQTDYNIYFNHKDEVVIWNGTTWKAITKLQDNNIEFYTVDNGDFGLTIIKYKDNPQQLQPPTYLSKLRYEYVFNHTYDNNTNITNQGKFILHVITEEQFKELF